MAILAFVLNGLAAVLGALLSMVLFVVIARAVISWVNPDPSNPIVRFLRDTTDPLLRPLQRLIPPIGPGIDITPIILILVIYFLQESLVPALRYYAHGLVVP